MTNNARSAFALSPTDIEIVDADPRIKDVRIGQRLGMSRPTDIRRVIKANQIELERYGLVRAVRAPIVSGKGRVTDTYEYYLNEAQTLLLCMLSRTARAAEVRQEVITVYMDYRRGQQVDPAALVEQVVQAVLARLSSAPVAPVVPAMALPSPDHLHVQQAMQAITRPASGGEVQAARLYAAYGRAVVAIGIPRRKRGVALYQGLVLRRRAGLVPDGQRVALAALLADLAVVGYSPLACLRAVLVMRGRRQAVAGSLAALYVDAAQGRLTDDIYQLLVAVVRDALGRIAALLDGQPVAGPSFRAVYAQGVERYRVMVRDHYAPSACPRGADPAVWRVQVALHWTCVRLAVGKMEGW